MITLSVVKIKIPNKKALTTRADLDYIRGLITGVKAETDKDTQQNLNTVLAGKYKLPSGVRCTLSLDTVRLNSDFVYVYSTKHTLSRAETERLLKVVQCAMASPNTLLVFPDYIVISDTMPPDTKLKSQKRGKKHDPEE